MIDVVDEAVRRGVEEPDAKTALSMLAVNGGIVIGWSGELRVVPEEEREVWVEPDADW